MTNASVEKVDTSGKTVKASVKTQDGNVTLEADIVLSAVGVSTNIENIGLEGLGIKTDKGRVLVDKHYKTNVDGVYAIGDIVPGQALAHVAMKEAVICVEAIGKKEGKYHHEPEALSCGRQRVPSRVHRHSRGGWRPAVAVGHAHSAPAILVLVLGQRSVFG